ncbi:DUF2848 domain-containing protein [Orrella daihaiensis]|uniref:DUF2848 family protein n=1 Tax=Orrella daihaiensis TaxID=2782176 RepID=A0ABY4AIU4_9BURK|nr:DUF2848 domain-containing protein [Orrella daihaiensis]UOD49863.1 DUF2848 family protein [Orrella daihaiensis]
MKISTPNGYLDAPVGNLIVAGWTGRNRAAVEHHIEELKAIGVPPPSTTPLFYRVSPELASADSEQYFLGDTASGEVEPVIIFDGKDLYLGTGSDHTDRAWETQSVAVSKQMCPKPIASTAWRFNDVKEHQDQLTIRSWVRDSQSDSWRLYQDGSLMQIMPLGQLLELSQMTREHRPGTLSVMLCGTVPTIGTIAPAKYFKFEIADPVLGQSIIHEYHCTYLPVAA